MTGREHDNAGRPRDALRDRYLEASAQGTQRPAARVRAAVLAHAQMQLALGARPAVDQPIAQTPAANQSRWKISLLASIALAGLTGLLVLQFERGTPDEKELALGQKPASESAAPSPSSEPKPAPQAAPSSSSPPAPAQSAKAVAPEPRQTRPSPARSPATSAAPLPAPSPFPASPQRSAPSPSTAETQVGLADAAPAPPAPAAPSPSAAARAQAPNQKPDSFNADAARGRDERGNAVSRADLTAPNLLKKQAATIDAETALQQTARNGSVAQLERLLVQGVPLQPALNAPDAAGRTPLVLAVINGHAAMVQRLLALGANPALVDQGGMNALQHARQRGRSDIAALIEAAP